MAKILFDNRLPNEYRDKHGFLMYLQDIAYNILKLQDDNNLSDLKIDFKNPPNKEIKDLPQFLEDNGYKNELIGMYKPVLLFSLVRDFSMYIGDSLKSIEGGRVSTAFALSRKPIQDTLFYLCWLLVDSDDLIAKLLWGSESKDYDISVFKKHDINFIKKIYDKSIEYTNSILDSDTLFEKIYKKNQNSLDPVWNMSLHIVTGDPRYKTVAGNLNFVFADDDIWDLYWDFYYTNFVHINFFALDVVLNIFEEIFDVQDNLSIFNHTIINSKYLMLLDIEKDENISILDTIAENISMTCDICNNEISDNEHYKNEFIYEYSVTCNVCNNIERIGTYFLSEEDIALIKNNRIIKIP